MTKTKNISIFNYTTINPLTKSLSRPRIEFKTNSFNNNTTFDQCASLNLSAFGFLPRFLPV